MNQVLDTHLQRERIGHALEIGCGTGFFYRWLAPDWLKDKIICADNQGDVLSYFGSQDNGAQTLLANAYNLPLRESSVNVVIGYSSFDSIPDLKAALREARRVLKKRSLFTEGGKLVLFQDLIPTIHGMHTDSDIRESVERYHQILCEEVEKAGYRILAEGGLQAIATEPLDTIDSRVRIDMTDPPVFGVWDRGVSHLLKDSTVKGNRELKEALQRSRQNANEAVEFINLLYLVARAK